MINVQVHTRSKLTAEFKRSVVNIIQEAFEENITPNQNNLLYIRFDDQHFVMLNGDKLQGQLVNDEDVAPGVDPNLLPVVEFADLPGPISHVTLSVHMESGAETFRNGEKPLANKMRRDLSIAWNLPLQEISTVILTIDYSKAREYNGNTLTL